MALGHTAPWNSASFNFFKFLSELLYCPWAKLYCAECMCSRYKVAVLKRFIGPGVQHTQAPFDLPKNFTFCASRFKPLFIEVNRWKLGLLEKKIKMAAMQPWVLLTKIVLPQDLGLVSAQDELVKRHFHFLTRVTFWSFFKLPLQNL